ncbi:STAS domain-containing protein [Streptosporangium sp. NPDC005286]|uniref:STAS domain-containing protein n=1 Tax=Streptosporangium sp. NPDC005286 TaxID=3154463 RepID=UPI0033A275D7
MNALQLTSEHASGFVVITVAGELDLATRQELSDCVQETIDACHETVIIDLSGVTFIDACGLSSLIGIKRYAREHDAPLLLAGAPPVVLRLLKLTHLEASFTVISRSETMGPPPGCPQHAPSVQASTPLADR